MQSRVLPILMASGIGVATGFYVFHPLLREYEADTHGTWIMPDTKPLLPMTPQQQPQQPLLEKEDKK
ncbi:hypothetical protein BDF14DRAFT_1884670 [Spinellus fusiger]|nr:hypothetical protein BDF14DRAFT_1884670 [Spinellus fusiger]